jgi:hypothetical protein
MGCVAGSTRDLELQGRKVKADEVHASFIAALGWWYAKLLSGAEFVNEARRGK